MMMINFEQNIPEFCTWSSCLFFRQKVVSRFGWIFLMLKFCTFKQQLCLNIFLSRFFSLLSSLSLRYIVFFFFKKGEGGDLFLKKNSGGLVALDGALKKFHQKRKRKMRVIVFSFVVLFLSGQEKCGVGNHAFFQTYE